MKILIAATHPDDEVLGAGGTIAKSVTNDIETKTIIFSYGENSNILEDDEKTIEKRIKESRKAGKILGSKRIIFFGLPDNLMVKELKDKKIKTKFNRALKAYDPDVVITHSIDDPHPAHAAVAAFVKRRLDESDVKAEVYTFNIWSPFKLLHRNEPRMVVDISSTFKKKKEAIRAFKSQKIWLYYPGTLSLIKDKISGIKEGYSAAEVFYKWQNRESKKAK